MPGVEMDMAGIAVTANARWVSIRIGTQEFAIDIMPVREVRGFTTPTFLPQAPRYVAGMIDLRGTVVPIIDLADRLGLPPIVPTQNSVIVIVERDDKLTGLLVDQVLDLLAVPANVQAPFELGDNVRRFIAGTAIVEGRILHLIALDNVLAWNAGESDFAANVLH